MTNPHENIPDGSDPAELANWLFDLARAGESDRLAAYIDAGAPIDMRNQNGDTLIMLAAYNGHEETVRALLERGADPNITNERGQAPLAGAVFKKENAVIAALIEGGADLDHGTPSARDTAAMFGVDLPGV
ncbi:ankyrin repeat domain-containing protein [Trueperella sp.]|uniref:ankyrin repeat domain-containing protein n=1 Tax=Trueperella sp. TaxID=2699835 RepID=UPI003735F062